MGHQTIEEIQSQIAELQQQAQVIKERDFAAALIEVQAKINTFGIRAADLHFQSKEKLSVSKKSASTGKKAPIKYRGANGETWTGRGLRPRWLVTAIEAGQTLESMAVAE